MTTAGAAPGRRRLIEAVAWRTHLAEIGVESNRDFEDWLAGDPECDRAWRQVSASWEFFDEHTATTAVAKLRRRALANAYRDGVEQRARGSGRRRRGFAFAAAALLAIVIGIALWPAHRSEVYRTRTGEMRVVVLQDGSKIALDSQSEIVVAYSREARELQLTHGQARFDVAHDVSRPFSVVASHQKVLATGTAFNIDVLSTKVLITLISGSVSVLPSLPAESLQTAPLQPIRMRAGEQLRISETAPPVLSETSGEQASAWQSGRLIFDNEPLASVVERISRYSDRPLRIIDAATGALRVSGSFKAGDIDGFVQTATIYFGVQAEHGAQGEITLRRRG